MAVETTNTMIERGSATAPVRVVNISAPVRESMTCPPFRVSAPKPHVRSACGTPPSTTSMMPLDQVWCELRRTPLVRSSENPPSTHSGEFLQLRTDTGRFDHAPRPVRLVITDLDPSLPYTVPEFDRELRGFLGAPGRHNDAVRVVRREIRCDAASHDLVAASDQDASVLQHRLHLLWRAGSQFPGANDAARFG